MTTTFYTSDSHFFHLRIAELCGRPFKDVDHMNSVLVDNWNRVVMPDDTVFHLGDLALGDKSRWDDLFARLNGNKILVIGNHDALFKGNKPRYIEKYAHHYRFFSNVYDNVEGHVLSDGTIVNLSHFPYDGDSHGEDRYSEFRLPDNGIPLIHGHVHKKEKFSRSANGAPQVHVGVDAWSFRLVSEAEVIQVLLENT